MNNREKCIAIIDFFTEEQLESVVNMLEAAKNLTIVAADDSFCSQMYDKYVTDEPEEPKVSTEAVVPDEIKEIKEATESVETIIRDFAREFGIDIPLE